MRYLVTGGAGYLGGQLCAALAAQGHAVTILDRVEDAELARRFAYARADLRDFAATQEVFERYGPFDGVFHLAALLAHAVADKRDLLDSNVAGTRHVAEAAARAGTRRLVYTSSNCVVGKPAELPVAEDAPIRPLELYGASKREGERVLAGYRDRLDVTTIRCPTIMGGGRLGLLSILYEFIQEGRKVWVLGRGANRYQFVYAPDLVDALGRAIARPGSHLYHIGADDVPPLREAYQAVIDRAGTTARVAGLPKAPAVAALRALHLLGLSPLGPYHYKMLAEDFVFDTTRIKAELGWLPTKGNAAMLVEGYEWFVAHREDIYANAAGRSAHRQPVKLQALTLVKKLS